MVQCGFASVPLRFDTYMVENLSWLMILSLTIAPRTCPRISPAGEGMVWTFRGSRCVRYIDLASRWAYPSSPSEYCQP